MGFASPSNGAGERLIRSLYDSGRAMHRDATLPPEQCGASMKHACVIVSNRLPAAAAGEKTQHELMLGEKPDVRELKAYGSHANADRPQDSLGEMVDRAENGSSLGVAWVGIRFLPDGAKKWVAHRDEVVEESRPLKGEQWFQHRARRAESATLWPINSGKG